MTSRASSDGSSASEPIAIIGMACRYPGAPDLRSFWRMLSDGVDAVGDVPKERWDSDALYDPNPAAAGKLLNRRGGYVAIDSFDAAFFGISPREAPHIDPRQRLTLEVTWEALESASIPPHSLAGSRTGVFMSTLTNDYGDLLMSDLQRIDALSGAGTANSVVANRVSYFLDLHGPSVSLDTACSGSLVAIHLACASLRGGESTLALAGGVSVDLLPRSNVFFSRAGALAPDGRCKTFDRAADGIVRSEGAGMIVLKRLSRAIADGDSIVAVIGGTAVNHDGRSNGMMAPNGQAQRALLEEVYRRAGIEPAAVQYVEAHGTGTRLGDPIEVEALGAVLTRGRDADRRCVLGSLKTNIGHTEAAAGVGGVIKTALAIQHRMLPGTVHFREPNPLIRLDELPFDVRASAGPWPSPGETLIAGVSGFGFGGTNAHVILREPPARPAARRHAAPPYILPVSARTTAALRQACAAYAELLGASDANAGEIAATAARGRSHHAQRMAVVGDSADALRNELARERKPASPGERLAFVFSGQGSHWAGMAMQLYEREPVMRRTLGRCDRLFAAACGFSLIEELQRVHESRLDDTAIAQPAIFSVQVALAQLWRSWGIVPDLVVGHSLGEVAAAHFAGALSLEDAVRIVAHRSRLMKQTAGQGRTAVIGLPFDDAKRRFAGSDVAVAGTNGPTTSVVAGTPAAIARVAATLEGEKTFCQVLEGVDVAFHSPQMDPVARELVASLDGLQAHPATIPILSAVTATEVDGTAFGASYWGRNVREPFLFTAATEELLARGVTTIVEIAPHAVLSSSIAQTARHFNASVNVLPSMRRNGREVATMLHTLAALYEEGRDVHWQAVYGGVPHHATLPHYPWQRKRYWLDDLTSSAPAPPPRAKGEHPLLHPLLGIRFEPADGAGALVYWSREIDANDPHYLRDHRIFGDAVLPGAAWIEMAAAAIRHGAAEPVRLTDIVFETPLRLADGERRRMQVMRSGDELSLFSAPIEANARWTRHAKGTAGVPPAGPAASRRGESETLSHQPARTPAVPSEGAAIDAREIWDEMETHGLTYGPAFRGITRLWPGDGEARARIELPAGLADERYGVHPALLDAAFQTVAAALPRDGAAALPAGVGEWIAYAPIGAHCWAHATARAVGDRIEADVTLFDDDGTTLARVGGLVLRSLGRTSTLDDALLEQRWETRPPSSTTTTAEPATIVDLRALDDPREILNRALNATQTLLRRDAPARLLFVTRGAQTLPGDPPANLAQAAAWGFAASAAMERPELGVRCIDLDGDEELAREAIADDDEARVAWRGGKRHVARLVRRPLARATDAIRIRDDGTYLITGGTGALGLLTARSLIARGARHIVLVSRRGGEVPPIDGVQPIVIAGDVADENSVDKLFATLWGGPLARRAAAGSAARDSAGVSAGQRPAARRAGGPPHKDDGELPPLRGIIHAAGITDDALLGDLSPERFASVFAPKARGAWNLHRRSAELDLDFFILYSSAASLVGSPGQSNYAAANAYLDALAHHRRALGLPALSVDWGAWDDGMAASDAARRRFAASGARTIDASEALDLLWRLASTDAAQVGVFPADWPKFLAQFPSPPPLFESFATAARVTVSLRDRLTAAKNGERRAILFDSVREAVAAVLGIDTPSQIGPRQRFFDLGIDSLMAVELRNRLQGALGVSLTSVVAFEHPTVEALAAHLDELSAPPRSPEAALSDDELLELVRLELGERGGERLDVA